MEYREDVDPVLCPVAAAEPVGVPKRLELVTGKGGVLVLSDALGVPNPWLTDTVVDVRDPEASMEVKELKLPAPEGPEVTDPPEVPVAALGLIVELVTGKGMGDVSDGLIEVLLNAVLKRDDVELESSAVEDCPDVFVADALEWLIVGSNVPVSIPDEVALG